MFLMVPSAYACVCVMQEQQQALLYQLMQQQQQQQQHDLQQLSSTQLPINNLLPAAQGAIAANPFLALHTDNSIQKAAVSDTRILQICLLLFLPRFFLPVCN